MYKLFAFFKYFTNPKCAFPSCLSFPSSPQNVNNKKIGSHKVFSLIEGCHYVESGAKIMIAVGPSP